MFIQKYEENHMIRKIQKSNTKTEKKKMHTVFLFTAKIRKYLIHELFIHKWWKRYFMDSHSLLYILLAVTRMHGKIFIYFINISIFLNIKCNIHSKNQVSILIKVCKTKKNYISTKNIIIELKYNKRKQIYDRR